MKGCRTQVIYINAEGRKGAVDISVLLAVVHGACASICVLIDEMNSGSAELILAEGLISLPSPV